MRAAVLCALFLAAGSDPEPVGVGRGDDWAQVRIGGTTFAWRDGAFVERD